MEFQNWTLAKNGIPKLDPGQKWNSKIGPCSKMEFLNWTLAKNGIQKLDPGQKWNSKIGPWPKMEFNLTLAKNGIPK